VNAYTSISGGGFQAPSPTYDPNGNTLTLPRPNGSSQALTWDAFDRLRSASNTQSQISKVYDPLGRLVWIRSIQSGQTAKDEIWSWTGWTLLTREVMQGSTTLDTFRYIWGPDLSTTLEGAGGVGGLLAIEHAPGNSTTWDIRYVHYDANGNVIALTDGSGSTSARYRYSPFGELIASEDLDNSGWNNRNIHRFSTKPEVTGTGLLYYGYRYYDPKTGRWPSRDPIEEEGGINLYGFVGNDGVNKLDILGLTNDLDRGPCKYSDGQCPKEWPVARNMRGTRTDEGKWEYSHSEPASMNDLAGLISNNFSWYSGVSNFGIIVNVYTKTEKWKCTYDCVCKGWGEATIAPATGSHTMDVPKTKRRYGLGNTSPGSGGGGV
jgi:RHS repeat-associated protein